MAKHKQSLLLAVLLLSFCSWETKPVNAAFQQTGRRIYLTLIPNYVENTIQFDGRSELNSSADTLDLTGLPFDVEHKWSDNSTWHIMGTVAEGTLTYDENEHVYHLSMGPISLRPFDELKLLLPFVSVNYSQVQPTPSIPDTSSANPLLQNHRLFYRAEADGWEIEQIDIPFVPAVKKIDLVITPLIGEVLIGRMDSFRLAGRVHFESLRDFAEFGHHCQNAVSRLSDGDYRIASLLQTLDTPHFFGPDVLNPAFQFKPTSVALRSELISCQYDREKDVGQVEAAFSGRVFGFSASEQYFPDELQGSDSVEENAPAGPGYEIRLGRIVLGPGDVLRIALPRSVIQTDSLNPAPDGLSAGAEQETLIEYRGPSIFDLSLPYIPQAQLYVHEFPAILRPGMELVEAPIGRTISLKGLFSISPVLLAGLLLLLFSVFLRNTWLVWLGCLLAFAGFSYGFRGSFGLLCLAVVFYISQAVPRDVSLRMNNDILKRIATGLAGFVLIFAALYFDRVMTNIFRGLSTADLSPLTPLVLMLLVCALFTLFYGFPKTAQGFTFFDLPVLLLFVLVPALYDAFDKSLIALSIVFLAGVYIIRRASAANKRGGKNGEKFGSDLQKRLVLAFGNRIVPLAIVIMIIFALVHDLSSTYANEMQIRISPLLTPIVIPLLAFASVFLAFTSIALLFVLVYPFLPSKAGYLKAAIFAIFLFLVFLFGIGTDDRLIAALPDILVGRVIYYFSVPVLIGLYIDINEFMKKENKRLAAEGTEKKEVNFQTAGSMYLKNIQGWLGTATGIISLLAPSIYAFVSNQPVISTYFSLLETLVLLPI